MGPVVGLGGLSLFVIGLAAYGAFKLLTS